MNWYKAMTWGFPSKYFLATWRRGLMKHSNGVPKSGCAISLRGGGGNGTIIALPKADKGSGWPPKLPTALRLRVHTQKLVCYSSHSATFLAWNCNSGTHYHVEKGNLGCIPDIKEQFQSLVYELKLWAIKTYLHLQGESSSCRLCPESEEKRPPWEVCNCGTELFRNLCLGEPVLMVTFSSLVGGTLFS